MRARLKLLLLYLLYWLAFFVAIRLVFLAFFHREALALPVRTLLGTLGHGLPLDLSATAYLSLLPFLLIALTAIRPLMRIAAWITIAYTIAATAVLSLLAAADLEIFRQWGRRIDAAVLQYLTHPREIWAAAGGGSPWLLLGILAALTVVFLLLAWRVFRPGLRSLPPAHPAWALPLAFTAALLIIPARGGIQQIPINQSSAYFTAEPFANQAAVNAGWHFFDSWLAGLNRTDNPYAVMSPDSARILIDEPGVDGNSSPTGLITVDRPNVILIMWESLTARAVGRLGGVPGTTPEFERLADSGLLFTRLYAAGDRTDKGLAALLSGAPTVPNASILKVPSKVRSLPMLSRDLHDAGYATAFTYGGELGFANIKAFALEGRFDRIVGKYQFPAALRTSKWGAHDEAVAERVLADLRDTREPFLTAWLTLSSHEPFDVPGEARITGTDGESRFRNSLAYTDHVVGEFIRRAAREPWWERTLVIIVSDHSKKLERTDADAPYKSAPAWYHIPMLWTGGALARRGTVVDAIMSQTDLTPTILGQLALPEGNRYKFGRDVFSSPPRSFAYYGFDGGFGVVTARGSLVWEQIPDRITSRTGAVDDRDFRRGRAMLQLTFQDYLDR